MKLFRTRNYLIIIGVALVAFIFGIFFDKDISTALYLESNLHEFGAIVSSLCLAPFLFLSTVIGSLGIASAFNTKRNLIRIPFIIVIVGALGFLAYNQWKIFYDDRATIGNVTSNVIGLTVAVLGVIGGIILAKYLYKNVSKEMAFRITIFYVIVVLIAMAIGVALKYLWSRTRPLYIFIPGNESLYNPIWELHPFRAFKVAKELKDFYKSFPSNHTVSCSLIFISFFAMLKIIPSLDTYRNRVFALGTALLITIIVAICRLLAGAHFLSDVSFAAIISYSVAFFSFKVVDKLNEKKKLFEC